jgi:hypothetical protein
MLGPSEKNPNIAFLLGKKNEEARKEYLVVKEERGR